MKKYNAILMLAACSSFAVNAEINLPDFSPLVEEMAPVVTTVFTEVKVGRSTRSGPSGSGFVISSDGYILTNHHVVDNAEAIKVKLHDGRELSAKKIGDDEDSDLALLKVEGSQFKSAKIGDVNKLKAGAWVLAFGAPLGLEKTVTAGIVSAKGRSLNSNRYVPFIQSDVAINPGNSGGPLINVKGEVVGINSQILSSNGGGSIGLSFSIPIDMAMDIVAQLKTGSSIKRGFIGVGYQPVEQDVAEDFGLDRSRGAWVNSVQKASPADKAGVKTGDVITQWDGVAIEKHSDLPVLVGRTKPGKSVRVEVYRDGKPKQLTLIVGDSKDNGDRVTSGGEGSNARSLGLSVSELTPQQKEEAGIEHGVLVRTVEDGPAAEAGIRAGDIVVSINRTEIDSVAEFRDVARNLKAGRTVAVLIMRRGASQYLIMKIPE